MSQAKAEEGGEGGFKGDTEGSKQRKILIKILLNDYLSSI